VTQRVALIGHPLRRRHSAVMHDAAFAACGIDARFELRDIPADAVAGFVATARGEEWLGFGITAPYKRVIMDHLDEVEPAARTIGAVNNTVRGSDGRLVGFNTDSIGFAAAVRSELEVDLAGARVVVAGAGGAAHAVVHACLEAGVSQLVVANRTATAAEALVGRFAAGGTELLARANDEVDGALADADLLVNATTVGMIDGGVALPPEALPRSAAVFDLVYVPAETELLARARSRGLRTCNGAAMLVAQGVAAFERWTGIGGTDEVMRRAIEPLLREAPRA
jgi:shikimate dehydrogenase